MKIERLPDGSLVIHEAFRSLRVVCLVGAILIAALITFDCLDSDACGSRERNGAIVASAMFGVVGLLVPDSTFRFDVRDRTVHWVRDRVLTRKTGTVPFADVLDVRYRTALGDTAQPIHARRYQLVLATRRGEVRVSSLDIASPDDAVIWEIKAVLSR